MDDLIDNNDGKIIFPINDEFVEKKRAFSPPEGIGHCEDSGFSSIAGSVATENSENDDRSKFPSVPNWISKRERERQLHQEQAAAKREAELKFESEKREKAYKRLMHLLNKSKFFTSFLIKKLNGDENASASSAPSKPKSEEETEENASARPAPLKRKHEAETDEEEIYSPPPKKSKRGRKPKKGKASKKAVTAKKAKSKMNEAEIEADLSAIVSDDEKDVEMASGNGLNFKPKYFVGELRDYQEKGLQWLKALYENGVSGILADEMGLGKTVQVIAMIAHLIEKEQAGPFLIIAPLSTLPNWLAEFERFAPKIPVVLLHGTQEEKALAANDLKKKTSVDGFKTQPVVLTTYEVPVREKKVMRSQRWRYIIIDEGQRIKNPECQLVTLLETCKSMNRLLLTGTPLQNSLKELWSLLHFLMPDIFNDLAIFESWFDVKDLQHEEGTARFLQQEEEKKVLQTLREILKPFMLRRLKNDVCLDIPPKKEVMVYCKMTKLQHDLYSGFLNRDISTMFKTKPEPLIIDDEFGRRPKRRCAVSNRYSGVFVDAYAATSKALNSSFSSVSSEDDPHVPRPVTPDPDYILSSSDSSFAENDPVPESSTAADVKKELNLSATEATVQKAMKHWTDHVEVTDDNCQYLFRLSFGSRQMMYRKIINHPYLIHMPLNDAGLPKVDNSLITASGKLMVLDKMLKELHEKGHKVLLFSTMKIILDVIEDYLSMRPWKYLRLDGEVKVEDRKVSIQAFNSDPDYFLFLITTRAGGVGLNLAGADTVIIFDSDWNPQADIQAMARCHRIGQNKPVVIYRLCTKGTFDEAIVNRAEAKRKLEKLVISKEVGQLQLTSKEGLVELKKLLESNHQEVVSSEQDVLTDEEIKKILDRSDLLAQMQKPKDLK